MSDEEVRGPSETMRGRAPGSGAKLWVLMNADRWLVAAALSVGVFAVLVAVSFADLAPARRIVSSKNGLWWFFSPMVGGLTTGVTLVVTFNQLVLSQEQGPLGDQRERMQGSMEFREDVESWLDLDVSPADPASFLGALVDGVQTYANELETAVESGSATDQLQTQVHDYVQNLTDHARRVENDLNGAEFGDFDVLYTALDFNYSWKIYEAKRLAADHDGLDEDAADALDDLVRTLEFFGPAREHVKTLYFQWELVNLSRVLLYTAVPALVVTVLMMFYVDATAVTGTTLGVDHLVWLLAATTTVTLAPFFLLVSYILRIATVAKRTLAVGPFILRETDRSDDLNRE